MTADTANKLTLAADSCLAASLLLRSIGYDDCAHDLLAQAEYLQGEAKFYSITPVTLKEWVKKMGHSGPLPNQWDGPRKWLKGIKDA
jgi:hypothetical protein